MSKIDKLSKLVEEKNKVYVGPNSDGNITYDSDTGYCSMSQPGWYGPEMHPLAAYRTAKKYFKSYDEFKNKLNISKTPKLRVSGNDITDALFVIFGGMGGLKSVMDSVDERIPEEQWDKFTNAYDEDDMIEYVYNEVIGSADETKVLNFVDNLPEEDIWQAVDSYVYIKCGVDLE